MNNERETEEQLCDRWEKWCKEQGMECHSADEFLYMNYDILTTEQRQYVSQFIITWDKLMYPNRD